MLLVIGLMSSLNSSHPHRTFSLSFSLSFSPADFGNTSPCSLPSASAISPPLAYKDRVRCRKMVHFSLSICSFGMALSFSPDLRSFSATISTSMRFTPGMSFAS